MRKAEALRRLAEKRRATRWPGYLGIGDFHGGVYECDHVSPYTKGAGNLDAEVFLLLLDWSSTDRLRGPADPDAIELGRSPGLATNRNLSDLLAKFFGLSLADTYATNLFPFVKPGGMSARIPISDLVRAAREFALPQVAIVRPRLVVCLGLPTFRAMQRALSQPPARNLTAAIADPLRHGASRVWCQSHPGGLGRANRNRGGVDRVSLDWAAMRDALRAAV